jgi:hypothetical protein
VKKPSLNTSTLKKGLHTADGLADHFSKVDCFIDRSMQFKYKIAAVVAPHMEVYKDMQKDTNQSKITSFFTKHFVSPSAM